MATHGFICCVRFKASRKHTKERETEIEKINKEKKQKSDQRSQRVNSCLDRHPILKGVDETKSKTVFLLNFFICFVYTKLIIVFNQSVSRICLTLFFLPL